MTCSSTAEPLREGIDYTIDEQGCHVFTKQYLLARGWCCECACRHCPWNFKCPQPERGDAQ